MAVANTLAFTYKAAIKAEQSSIEKAPTWACTIKLFTAVI